MFAALHLMLANDRDLLQSVFLAPLVTWVIIGGALYGALRLVIDVLRLLFRRRPPQPPPPPRQPPRNPFAAR